jgi:hypothetical protein
MIPYYKVTESSGFKKSEKSVGLVSPVGHFSTFSLSDQVAKAAGPPGKGI